MKKIFLFIAAICVFSFANAQNNIVKVNPIGFMIGGFKVSFEHSLNEKNSIVISGRYLNITDTERLLIFNEQSTGFSSNKGKITGFDIDFSYRYYFPKNNKALEGLFFAPFINIQSLKTESTCNLFSTRPNPLEATYNYFGITTGVVAGHQWLFDSGLSIDLFLGYGYRFSSTNKEENEKRPCVVLEYYNRGIPKLDIAIGYNF